MAADSRRALIDAGVALVIGQRWQDLHSAVSTRAITERAGVTTGSFFHHFRNRAHFAEVLADEFLGLWDVEVQRLLQDVEDFGVGGGGGGVRTVAESDWVQSGNARAMTALQLLLWVSGDQPLSDESTVTSATVLGDAYRAFTAEVAPAYARVLEALGREMLPPFTTMDLAITMTALGEGLRMRGAVDARSVRDGLFSDVVAAVLIALTRPMTERATRRELAALEVELEEQVRVPVDVGLDGDDGAGQTWRQIADAAAPLFVERTVGEVRIAEIAEVAGVSTSTVYHQFRRVSAVAAAGWAGHLSELQAISAAPLTTADGPITRIEQVLTRFVELGRERRGMLEGLVVEVLSSASAGDEPRRRWAATSERPFVELVAPHLRELRARGQLRRRIDTETLALTMVQIAATRTLLVPEEPVERIVDDAVELLLHGALARPAD